jgi:hypothetical protein
MLCGAREQKAIRPCVLGENILYMLRAYFKEYRPKEYLFEEQKEVNTVKKVCKS